MTAELVRALLLSLVSTLVLEGGIYLLVYERNKKDMLLVGLVNLLTNPAVVLLYWIAATRTEWNLTLVKIALEASAVLVEGCYYKKYGQEFKRPLLFSLAANMFSFGVGVLVQLFLGGFS